jgi:hypothetical protein
MQAVITKQQAAIASLIEKVEAADKKISAAQEAALAAKDSSVRFFGQVAVPRLLGFKSIPADGEVSIDAACVQASKGDWLPLSYPLVYVPRAVKRTL